MIKIIVINGFPRSGKDEFIKQCQTILGERCGMCSSVDFVKQIAAECGWNGEKTPNNRKFLSDLKDLLANWGDVPVKKMKKAVENFRAEMDYYDINGLFFLVVREPEEIERLKNELGAESLLIRRLEAENQLQSNHADSLVMNYVYDYVIHNNGTIEDLNETAKGFIKNIFNKGEIKCLDILTE